MSTGNARVVPARRLGVLTLAVIGVVLFGACGANSPGSSSKGSATQGTAATGGGQQANLSPIKIGVLGDLTGGAAALDGRLMRIGLNLAVAQINGAGGVNGHPITLDYTDTKNDPAEAVSQATQLVQRDHVDLLLGGILSSECLGVQKLVPKLGVVYLPTAGCANEEFSAADCNRFSFRLYPVGRQLIDPEAGYLVKTYGKRWAIAYPDYAFGQSQLQAYQASLDKVGASLSVKIPVPLNETNMAPYITKIPLDGSVDGVIASFSGGDQARALQAMQQFGVNKKLPIIIGSTGKEFFGGIFPDAVNGSVVSSVHVGNPQPDNKFDQAFFAAYKDQIAKDHDLAVGAGEPSQLVPGSIGYYPYATMMMLKQTMIASKFTGKADTEKLISTIENFSAPLSADFPAGPVMMSKTDHQGRMEAYIYKINGQNEEVLQQIPPDQLPSLGNCKVS